jgi:hypothetical protein
MLNWNSYLSATLDNHHFIRSEEGIIGGALAAELIKQGANRRETLGELLTRCPEVLSNNPPIVVLNAVPNQPLSSYQMTQLGGKTSGLLYEDALLEAKAQYWQSNAGVTFYASNGAGGVVNWKNRFTYAKQALLFGVNPLVTIYDYEAWYASWIAAHGGSVPDVSSAGDNNNPLTAAVRVWNQAPLIGKIIMGTVVGLAAVGVGSALITSAPIAASGAGEVAAADMLPVGGTLSAPLGTGIGAAAVPSLVGEASASMGTLATSTAALAGGSAVALTESGALVNAGVITTTAGTLTETAGVITAGAAGVKKLAETLGGLTKTATDNAGAAAGKAAVNEAASKYGWIALLIPLLFLL